MRRLILFLFLIPAICFGQNRADRDRTNPVVTDCAGYGFRGHWQPAAESYCAEALALFARMTTPPTTTRKDEINTLIVGLKTAGIWSKMDAMYVLAAADEQAALLNWVADTNNATAENSPSFVADSGFAGNGSTSFINTNYNPSTDGVHYEQNSASFGYLCLSDGVSNVVSNGVVVGGNYLYSLPYTDIYHRMCVNYNSYDGVKTAVTSAKHYAIGVRDATVLYLYLDGTQTALPAVSYAVPNGNVYMGGTNVGPALAEPNNYRYACCFLGSALDSTEAVALTTLLEAYMDAVGCGILP